MYSRSAVHYYTLAMSSGKRNVTVWRPSAYIYRT